MRTRRPTRRRATALLAAGVLMAAACGADSGDTAPDAAPAVTAPASPPAVTAPASPPATTGVEPAPAAPDDAGSPSATDPPTDADSDGTTTPDATPDATGDAVPEILQVSGSVVGGGELDLAAYGDRPVLLWFWAPF